MSQQNPFKAKSSEVLAMLTADRNALEKLHPTMDQWQEVHLRVVLTNWQIAASITYSQKLKMVYLARAILAFCLQKHCVQ